MSAYSVSKFTLLDGTKIPWLGWGSGSGKVPQHPIESGNLAIEAGFRHIDTAQLYGTEQAIGEVVASAHIPRSDIFVTTKLSQQDGKPVPVDQVRSLVNESIRKLGFIPDLLLIHNPFVASSSAELKATWTILEDLAIEGHLKSIGVSNFRPQDLEAVLQNARIKPAVNQLEYHPYVLTHLQPVLELQAKHGILTESFGPLTPLLRHPDGGPIKPILERIATRLCKVTGKAVDTSAVLLLWTKAQGMVAVTTSGTPEHIKSLAEVALLPDLDKAEVDEITEAGKKVHFRHYTEHMEVDFPLPDLPNGEGFQ